MRAGQRLYISSLLLLGLGCNPYAADYDGDGIPAGEDCDDYDAQLGRECDPTTSGTGDDDTVPGDDDTVSGDDDTVSGDDDTVSGDDDTVPGDDDTVPGDDDTASGDDDTVSGDDDTVPGDDDTVPGDDDTVPGDDDTVPGDDDTVSGDDDTGTPSCPLVTVYADQDGDGYGDPASSQEACADALPTGVVLDGQDCDDGMVSIHPEATEQCNNGVDDNCDGLADLDDVGACGVDTACRIAPSGTKYSSIQAAVGDVLRGRSACAVLWVAPGTYLENLNLSGLEIPLRSESGPATTILDGKSSSMPVISVREPGEGLEVSGFTIRGGSGMSGCPVPSSSSCGGGIFLENGARPVFINNRIVSNSSQYGGGIFAYGKSADGTFTRPTLQGNQVGDQDAGNTATQGGGLYVGGGAGALLQGNVFRANGGQAHQGTALMITGNRDLEPVTSRGDTIEGHAVANATGTIFLENAHLEATELVVSDNLASSGGGLFSQNRCVIRIGSGSRFERNQAGSGGGGAISSSGDILYLEGDAKPILFDQNTGFNNRGGALSVWASSVTIRNAAFLRCSDTYPGGNGGAIAAKEGSQLSLSEVYFGFNRASLGSALAQEGGQLTMQHCILDRNEATGSGGALFLAAQATVTGCIFHQNRGLGGGSGKAGALWIEAGYGTDVRVEHNTFVYDQVPNPQAPVMYVKGTDQSQGVELRLEDNIFFHPLGDYGLVTQGPGTLTDDVVDDGVSDNVFYDYLYPFGGTLSSSRPCLTADPRFEASSDDDDLCNEDLRLGVASPYLDLGDASGSLDADGSPAQPGAMGGAEGDWDVQALLQAFSVCP